MCATVTYRTISGTSISDIIKADVSAEIGGSVEISFDGGYIHLTRDPDDGTWEIGASSGAFIYGVECKKC